MSGQVKAAVYTNGVSSDLCACGQQQTMNQLLSSPQFGGGLQSLQKAGDDASVRQLQHS